MLVVEPVHAAEIRNATFCGDSGTSEKYYTVAVVNHGLQLLNLIHRNPSVSFFSIARRKTECKKNGIPAAMHTFFSGGLTFFMKSYKIKLAIFI